MVQGQSAKETGDITDQFNIMRNQVSILFENYQ